MVRLRAAFGETLEDFNEFQFQYGEIERALADTTSNIAAVFQFQYGEIESRTMIADQVITADFNSNMVRLRGIIYKSLCTIAVISIPIW